MAHLIGQGEGSAEVGEWSVGISLDVGEAGVHKNHDLLLNMMEPIHRTGGKVVMGDSGFCVTEGMMTLDTKGV